MRIVSLVPSLTELLFQLGLVDQIVGRTKFCIHPSDSVSLIPKIGGTKNVNIQKVIDLNPDLIIANKEENTKEDVEALESTFHVHVSHISNYEEAIEAIKDIGLLTNRQIEAESLVAAINSKFSNLEHIQTSKRVAYIIWQNPYMTVGADTFIHDMLRRCGFINVFHDQTRYPTFSAAELIDLKPDIILLSSEPFPFKEKHIQSFENQFPNAKVKLVDGEFFSWYGNRMLGAADYFNELIAEIGE